MENHPLALARIEAGLSQEALARLAKVSVQQISRWERGVAFPHERNWRNLSQVLGIPMEELFPFRRPKSVPPKRRRRTKAA